MCLLITNRVWFESCVIHYLFQLMGDNSGGDDGDDGDEDGGEIDECI